MDDRSLIPEGFYDAVAVEVVHDERLSFAYMSENKKGTRQVVVSMRLLNCEWDGRMVPWYGYLTVKTAERTCQSLRYMGLKGDLLDQVEHQQLNQIVRVKVEINEYNGNTSNRIGWIDRHGSSGNMTGTPPMSEHDKKEFSALMRQSMAKLPEETGPRHEENKTPTDDELPF